MVATIDDFNKHAQLEYIKAEVKRSNMRLLHQVIAIEDKTLVLETV